MAEVTLYHAELARLVDYSPQSVALFEKAGKRIRDQARANANSIGSGAVRRDSRGRFIAGSRRSDAIDTDLGRDSKGLYVDVGYNKHHPGFVLWWAEVGSRHQSPSPHLRPAVQAGRV